MTERPSTELDPSGSGGDRPTLLLAVDLPVGFDEVRPAVELASTLGWRLHVLHVTAPEPAFFGYPDMESPTGEAHHDDLVHQLDTLVDAIRDAGVEVDHAMVPGPTVDVILANAEVFASPLIAVVGQHKNLGHRLVLGSVAAALLKTADRPVLVLPSSTGASERGFSAAVERLIELIDRTEHHGELSDLRQRAEERRASPPSGEEVDDDDELLGGLRDAVRRFETDHPSLTKAVNDVAYFLSGMGI